MTTCTGAQHHPVVGRVAYLAIYVMSIVLG